MSRWFRLYDCLLDDPKVQRLPGEMFKTWVNLLCVASKYGGKLPGVTDLAFLMRMDITELGECIQCLAASGLIDQVADALEPHNWQGRQHKSDDSSDRVKRHRAKRECNGDDAVTVTPPDTDTDTEQKDTREDALISDWPKDAKQQFWKAYRKRIGKQAVFSKLDALRRKGISFRAIMDGLHRYHAGDPDPKFIPNPLTWLNQGRWEDEPAGASNVVVLVPTTGPVAAGFWAHRESKQFEAWIDLGHHPPGKTDRNGGWLFPSEWPPSDSRPVEAAE